MIETERLSVALRLKEASATLAELFESLACGTKPAAMLFDAHKLGDLANEVETTLAALAAADQPVLPFAGDDVVLGDLPSRTADEDRASQYAFSREQRSA